MINSKMIRDAKTEDTKDIVNFNVMGWINTYKGIFPEYFLNQLNSNDQESIQVLNAIQKDGYKINKIELDSEKQ